MDQPLLYSKYNGFQKTDAVFALRKFLPSMKFSQSDQILDVGSGDGHVTLRCLVPLLEGNFANLVGMDKSQKMVEFAKSRNTDGRVDFVVGDVAEEEDVRGMRGAFDHVFSFFCLNWVQNQRQAWQNIHDLLKPGGSALILFCHDQAFFRVYEIQTANPKWSPYLKELHKHMTPYLHCENPAKSLEKHVKNAGFSVKICDVFRRTHVFPSRENLIKSIAAVNAFIKNMPEDLVDEYLEEFVNTMRGLDSVATQTKDGEEVTTMDYEILLVLASRPLESD